MPLSVDPFDLAEGVFVFAFDLASIGGRLMRFSDVEGLTFVAVLLAPQPMMCLTLPSSHDCH